jgi:hypothetical protein
MMAPDLTPTPIARLAAGSDLSGMIALPVLNFDTAPDATVTITADMPALGLRAGQDVTLRLSGKIDCDAIFAFQDGTFARLQTLFDGTYRVTGATGPMRIIARADLPPVLGWIVQHREGGRL